MKTFTISLLFAVMILFKGVSYSQTLPIAWQSSIGGSWADFARDICLSPDSMAYYVLGYGNSTDGDMTGNHGGMDVFVTKFDLSGNTIWHRLYGGLGNDYPQKIMPLSDGNILICGFTTSNDSLIPGNHGGFDVLFIKIDTAGTSEWLKVFGGTGDEGDHSADVIETADKGFLCMTGSSSVDGDVSANYGSSDFWLFKTDSAGNIQWDRNYGGSDDEDAHSIMPMPDGGYIIAGHTASNDSDVTGHHNPNSGIHDGWVVRLDSSKNIKWQKCIGGTDYEVIMNMCFDNAGHVVTNGVTNSVNGDITGNHGQYDVWVCKLDTASGNLFSSVVYGGTGYDSGNNLFLNDDGSLTFDGYTSSVNGDVAGNHGDFDCWVFKTDTGGNILWQGCYGGSSTDGAANMTPSPDKGIVITSSTLSSDSDVVFNHGIRDSWVFKINCVKPQPAFAISHDSICAGDSVMFNNNSTGAATYSWYVNRNSRSSTLNYTTVFPNSGTYIIQLVAAVDNCLDSVTASVFINPFPVVNLGNDTAICSSCFITPDAGNPGATYLWSTGATTQTITINAPDTIFVDASFNGCTASDTIIIGLLVDIADMSDDAGFHIYQDQSAQKIFVSFDPNGCQGTLTLLDVEGRLVISQKAIRQKEEIDVSNMSKGIYALRASCSYGDRTFKVVVN